MENVVINLVLCCFTEGIGKVFRGGRWRGENEHWKLPSATPELKHILLSTPNSMGLGQI